MFRSLLVGIPAAFSVTQGIRVAYRHASLIESIKQTNLLQLLPASPVRESPESSKVQQAEAVGE